MHNWTYEDAEFLVGHAERELHRARLELDVSSQAIQDAERDLALARRERDKLQNVEQQRGS